MRRTGTRSLLLLLTVALLAAGAAAGESRAGEGPPVRGLARGGWYKPRVEFESIEYIVVTGRSFVEPWKVLSRWKTRKGVPADVVAIEDILNNPLYRGTDGPETLRNFISDLYWKWGLEWVLLGGDVNIVPARMIQTREDGRQAADLYYSALDGSWNTDCNAEYGGTEDRTDHVEKVYVGRVPIETVEEIDAFLNKFFLYIKPKHRDYQTRALLVGAILGSDATWDADDHYQEIKADAFVPAGFEVTELEESENLRGDLEEWKDKDGRPFESGYAFGKPNNRKGPSDLKHFLKYMNRGTGVVSHIIHSNVYLMGLGKGWITKEHVLQLKNAQRPTVIYSSGCQVNMFNMESISEHLLLYPKGGAVAFIGCTVNSYAFQNKFERDFWEALFFHGVHRIGRTLAASKARRNFRTSNNIPSDPITILIRGLNLLGDPEMSIWTKTPADLTVTAPETARLGETSIEVSVLSGGKPLRDALVCMWKEGEHHAAVKTGVDGKARVPVRSRFPGMAHLTVSARNHVPFEGKLQIGEGDAGGEGPVLTLADLAVADGAEGILDAGEKASVPLALWNSGTRPVSGATARVTGIKGKIRVIQGEAAFPDVPPKGAAVSTRPLVLQAGPDAPPGHRAVLEVEMRDGKGGTWKESLPIYVNASWVVRLGQAVVDENSDGDGRITIDDAGNTVDLFVELGNLGSGCARNVKATLGISGTGITVKNPTLDVGDVPVGARVRVKEPFHLDVTDDFDGAALECRLTLSSASGPRRSEEFFIEEPLDPPGELTMQGRVDSVRLTWEPVESDRIAGYNVYRAPSSGGPFNRVNPTLLTASCFEDSGLARTTEYRYRATALDRSLNESALSKPIRARSIFGQQRDWPKDTNGNVRQLTAADLDGDGDLEIGTGDGMGPWIWHHTGREVHHGGDFWTFGLFVRSGSSLSPVFADVDGKGALEVVVVSHKGGRPKFEMVNGQVRVTPGSGGTARIHVFDLNGKDLRGWPKNLGGPCRCPALVADLDGNGKPEILALKKNGTFLAFRADGSRFGPDPLAKIAKDATPPTLADLDGDGDLEIVGIDGEGKLYAFHHDGKAVAGLSFDAGGKGKSFTAVGDLDGDGAPEIVFCGEEGKKLFALRADGKPVPGFPASIQCGKATLLPALADLTGDGKPEIVVAGGKKLFAFGPDGNGLNGFPVEVDSDFLGVAVGDVDGDGKADIVSATKKGIFGFRADGTPLRGWPLISPETEKHGVRTLPCLCDVDLDGDIEVLAGAQDKVLIWDLPAPYHPGLVEWSGFAGGPRRLGVWRPPVPAPGSVSVTGSEVPAVRWSAVAGARGYHVYRGKGDEPLGRITAKAVTGSSYPDPEAKGGARFRYAVCAMGKNGRLSRFSSTAKWEDSRPKALLEEGETAAKGGDGSRAAGAFRRILREFPGSPLVGKARKALGALGESSVAGAGSSWAEGVRRQLVLGDAWAKHGHKRRAAACYRFAIEMGPDAPSAEEARVRLAQLRD